MTEIELLRKEVDDLKNRLHDLELKQPPIKLIGRMYNPEILRPSIKTNYSDLAS